MKNGCFLNKINFLQFGIFINYKSINTYYLEEKNQSINRVVYLNDNINNLNSFSYN